MIELTRVYYFLALWVLSSLIYSICHRDQNYFWKDFFSAAILTLAFTLYSH